MTLTFALTVLAIWFLVSIPVSLLLANMMRVEPDAGGGDLAIAAEPVLREIA
jgi:putative solute:sodium symporter small subunit